MDTLRKNTGHKFGLPAPTPILELGSWLIGTETELILKSRWVYPARALKEGFEFSFPAINEAIKNIVDELTRSQYHLF